jgi:hypothetical protein
MDKRVWTITVQNGWFNGDPPVEVSKVIKLTDNLDYPPGSFLTKNRSSSCVTTGTGKS